MALKKECQGVAEDVILRILQEWLEGKGLPVTWETLIQTLRKTGLSTLAEDLSQHPAEAIGDPHQHSRRKERGCTVT